MHLGALPYLVGRAGLKVPIYATGAVHKMGQMFLYDAFLTRHACSEFEAFSLDDIDAAFAAMTTLRFRQEASLSGKGSGISITPFPAGRLLGGAVWRISYGGEDFVYALDFNHRRERHLVGAPLEATFLRPALFVSDAMSFGRQTKDRNAVERSLIDACMSTVRGDGNVLIPIDAAGRLFEVLLVLERHWSEHRLTYPLLLVGPMARTTLDFARSSLEWMNENLTKSFGHSKDNPFNFRYLKAFTSLAGLKKLPRGPKVVLATDLSLEAGAARQLFVEWAHDPRNLIIVATEPDKDSLCEQIVANCGSRNHSEGALTVEIRLGKRVPLKGEELEEYIQKQKKARRKQSHADDRTNDTVHHEGGGKNGRGYDGDDNDLEGEAKPTRMNTTSIGHLSHHAADRVADANMAAVEELLLPLDATMDEIDEGILGHCLIEGFEIPEGAVGPIFPAEDSWEAKRYDEYGAITEFEGEEEGGIAGGRLGRKLASEAAVERTMPYAADLERASRTTDATEAETAAVEEDETTAMIPTKIESKDHVIEIRASVIRVDFDGRSDGRSVQTILSHIAPRSTILVHSSEEAALALAARLENELEGLYANVYVPSFCETIEIPMDPSFRVEISDTLLDTVEMHAVGGYELAWVDGRLGPQRSNLQGDEGTETGESGRAADRDDTDAVQADARKSGAVEKKENVHGEGLNVEEMQALPVLEARRAGDETSLGHDASAASAGNSYGGVFIGDVRLSELRKALATQGIASEFRGGALYCAGQVVVKRRGEGGGLVLEGAGSTSFYRVREIIYSQYHVA